MSPDGGRPVVFGVVVFPGSNCDADAYHAIRDIPGADARYLWHGDTDLEGVDCVVLPGGFSYGDYLRAGAIAARSPIMAAVRHFAGRGGLVLGICNGFQILVEAGLLPGAMRRNDALRFRCEPVWLRVENADTPFTNRARPGQVLRMPIAHAEGNYFVPPDRLAAMQAAGQVVFRYAAPDGRVVPEANPNGSVENVAGVANLSRNVLGLMPHPERACDPLLGSEDGRVLFESVVAAVRGGSPGSGAAVPAGVGPPAGRPGGDAR